MRVCSFSVINMNWFVGNNKRKECYIYGKGEKCSPLCSQYNRRYNVEDIIFEGDGIDKLKILSIMNKGRLTVEQEIKEEIPDERPKPAEKPVTVPAEKPDAVEADIKPEAKPKRKKPEKPKREKPPVIDIKPKKKKVLQHKSLDK